MKRFLFKYSSLVLVLFFIGFTISIYKVNHSRNPASEITQLSALEVRNMGPRGLLDYLKNNCCSAVIIETFNPIGLFTIEELEDLKQELGGHTDVSPVVSSLTGDCLNVVSNVESEIEHLKVGIKKGKYPSPQCASFLFGSN